MGLARLVGRRYSLVAPAEASVDTAKEGGVPLEESALRPCRASPSRATAAAIRSSVAVSANRTCCGRVAVEVTRADQDAEIGERSDGLPRVLLRRPEVEPGLAVVDAEPRPPARAAARRAAPGSAPAARRRARRRRARRPSPPARAPGHQAQVLAHGEQARDELRVAGDERRAVPARFDCLLSEYTDSTPREVAAGDRGSRIDGSARRPTAVPAELGVALVAGDDGAELASARDGSAQALGIEHPAVGVAGRVEPDEPRVGRPLPPGRRSRRHRRPRAGARPRRSGRRPRLHHDIPGAEVQQRRQQRDELLRADRRQHVSGLRPGTPRRRANQSAIASRRAGVPVVCG